MRTALATHGDQDAIDAIVAQMRQRQTLALYTDLLADPASREGVVYQCHRAQSGLRIIALRHDVLSERQCAALGEFRLHQYVLCGYYDPAVILSRGIVTDPALSTMPPDAVHILVGTAEGHLLAYFFMQPAMETRMPTDHDMGQHQQADATATPRLMGDSGRPLFPSEYDTFSPEVFNSLPALRAIPVTRVRELARLLRNQAIQSPISSVAAVEAIQAVARLTIHSGGAIEALIGNMGISARRLMARLKNPMLHAPFVPVVEAEPEYYWVPGTNLTGAFWPFVISHEDACAYARYYEDLDAILSLEPQVIRHALVRFNEQAHPNEPRAFVPAPGTCPIFWTSDPLYGEERPSTAHVGSGVGPTSRARFTASRRDAN